VGLKLTPVRNPTDDQRFELCELNRDWRIEYTAPGELILMLADAGLAKDGRDFPLRRAKNPLDIHTWSRLHSKNTLVGLGLSLL